MHIFFVYLGISIECIVIISLHTDSMLHQILGDVCAVHFTYLFERFEFGANETKFRNFISFEFYKSSEFDFMDSF